jgi:glucose/mannose-6-phosphate isomerase
MVRVRLHRQRGMPLMPDLNLDDVSLLQSHDPSDMLGAIRRLPDQIREALAFTERRGVHIDRSRARNIVISGLGGSAVGGDLLRAFAANKSPVPIAVNRHYDLPAYVGRDTCLIAVSYSGDTEETLSAYEQGKRAGAQIIAITSGGELARRAGEDGYGVLRVPRGLQPRAAVGYLFVPQVQLLAKAGLLPDLSDEWREAVEVLMELREELAPHIPADRNEAKQAALRLYGKVPIIHSAAGLTEIVSYRWKTQINENAQALAFSHVYPELNHNEVVGFDLPDDLQERVEVVTLRTERDHPQIERRIEITTQELLGGHAGLQVAARGRGELAQLFSLILFGDYVSAYLAFAYGIDPTPVEKIERLKRRLADW